MITKYDVVRKPFLTEKASRFQEDAMSSAVKKIYRALHSREKGKEISKVKNGATTRELVGKAILNLSPNSAIEKIEEAAEGIIKRKFVFQVHPKANKVQIKEAIEEFFDIKVSHVRTLNFKGKKKRFGRVMGRRNDWKKAIVTLKEGETFDIL